MTSERTGPSAGISLGIVVGLAMGPAIALGLARFAGAMNTANAAGISPALTSQLAALMSLRVMAGLMAALAFVAGGSMTAAVSGSTARAQLALGIYFAGGGLGVAISALTGGLCLVWRGLHNLRDLYHRPIADRFKFFAHSCSVDIRQRTMRGPHPQRLSLRWSGGVRKGTASLGSNSARLRQSSSFNASVEAGAAIRSRSHENR